MQPAPEPQRLTIEAFFDQYAGREEKYELVDGVPVMIRGSRIDMMAGGTVRHGLIALNILTALRRKLAGGPCRPLGSDVALRVAEDAIRYPDVAVYCDPEELAALTDDTWVMTKPKVVIEVLSPSTQTIDRDDKLPEYQALASVDTIALVHPRRRTMSVYERVDATRWLNTAHLPGADLVIRDPAVTLTADEIFEGL